MSAENHSPAKVTPLLGIRMASTEPGGLARLADRPTVLLKNCFLSEVENNAAEEMASLIESLVTEGYLSMVTNRYGEMGFLATDKMLALTAGTEGAELVSSGGDLSPEEKASLSLWTLLLLRGSEYSYYGAEPSRYTLPFSIAHILLCGLDLKASTAPVVRGWDTFDGTFAEEDIQNSGLSGYAACQCGLYGDVYENDNAENDRMRIVWEDSGGIASIMAAATEGLFSSDVYPTRERAVRDGWVTL